MTRVQQKRCCDCCARFTAPYVNDVCHRVDNVLRDCYQPAIMCIGQAVAIQQNIVECATERKILLMSIKLYSAADDDEQPLKKRKVQWWEYWAGQHSSLWFAADCAVYCYRAKCLSGLFWFAEQLLRSTVFSVLVFIRSHRTIHEPVSERKPVPCIRIVQTSVVAITSIHTRASSVVAVLMHRCFHLVMPEHIGPLWIYNDEVLVHQFKNCSVRTETLLEPTLLHQEYREHTILYSEEHPTIFVGFME